MCCNVGHSRADSVVQRCNVLFKGGWLCLDATDDRLPGKVCGTIKLYAVLHNLAVNYALLFLPEPVRHDAPPAA